MKITYYCIRPVQVGDEMRQPGDLIPEARDWAWINTYVQDHVVAPVLVASLPRKTIELLQQWEDEQELLAAINAEEGLKLSQEREAAVRAANAPVPPSSEAFVLPNGANHSPEVAI